ncbi:hypothetical protein KKG66_07485 [bacterium]|nr:hypothetical protein [bacterium]MBU1702710.1 hypothetical protein [Candidatus Eisenbacteria bacterium]MBU1920671.1 hypothetical protein [bacterium]
MRVILIIAYLLLLIDGSAEIALAGDVGGHRFQFELETGPVWQGRNDVQIPNDEKGTRYSLVDLAGKGPYPSFRFYGTWNINSKHGLRLLLAPLSSTETGEFERPVDFAEGSFEPYVPTDVTYRFNSWRLTYRYQLYDKSKWSAWIGFTAKIRDAKIQLKQVESTATETDLGFVPLLHLAFEYQLTSRSRLLLDLDALAGGPGRAEDLSVKLSYRLGERLALSGGYRTLEGGADVDRVYNFAWLHYAVISLSYRL